MAKKKVMKGKRQTRRNERGKEWKGKEKCPQKGSRDHHLVSHSILSFDRRKKKEETMRGRGNSEGEKKTGRKREKKKREGINIESIFFISFFHSLIFSLSLPFILFTFQSLFHSFEFLHKFMISSSSVN